MNRLDNRTKLSLSDWWGVGKIDYRNDYGGLNIKALINTSFSFGIAKCSSSVPSQTSKTLLPWKSELSKKLHPAKSHSDSTELMGKVGSRRSLSQLVRSWNNPLVAVAAVPSHLCGAKKYLNQACSKHILTFCTLVCSSKTLDITQKWILRLENRHQQLFLFVSSCINMFMEK